MRRKKIPKEIADELIFKSDRKCCVCKELGKQIHHIDGDTENSNVENLVFLCLNHHDEVSKSGGISRNLSPGLLRKYRSLLFQSVIEERRVTPSAKVEVNSTKSQTEESTFQQAYDASVVRSIHDSLWTLDYEDWNTVREWISRLDQYTYRVGETAALYILDAMYDIACRARRGMPGTVALAIKSVCRSYVYSLNTLHAPHDSWSLEMKQLLDLSAAIGAVLAYDGSLRLNDGAVFAAGTSLLWRALKAAIETGDIDFIDRIEQNYQVAVNGASRSKLEHSLDLIQFEKAYAKSESFEPIVYPMPLSDLRWLVWD